MLFSPDCIFCRKSGPRYIGKSGKAKEFTIKFKTDAYQTVQESAEILNDGELLRRIIGVDLFEKQACFRSSCRAKYKQREPTNQMTFLLMTQS